MGVTLKAMLERQSWKIPFFSLFQVIGQSICFKNQIVNFRVRWPVGAQIHPVPILSFCSDIVACQFYQFRFDCSDGKSGWLPVFRIY